MALKAKADLSLRGKRALQPALSYFEMVLKALENEATDANPDGYLPIAVSENRILNAPKMLSKLNECCAAATDKSSLGYGDFSGRQGFKEAYAGFVNATLMKSNEKTINPKHLAVSSGVGSLLAHLSSLLHDEGDAVLLPTPTYAALYNDFYVASGTKVIDVPMTPDYDITTAQLQVAYDQAVADGHIPKSVLLLNPENPLGIVRSQETLRDINDWCVEKGLHLILDEIYANSIHSPDQSAHPFMSGASLFDLNTSPSFVELPHHVHILWGLSKDWAASGLRVGVVYTSNPDLLAALSNVLYFSGVSNYLLDGLAHMLNDLKWSLDFIAENNATLHASYSRVTSVLARYGIPYVHASAGLFVWIDLSAYLPEATWQGEQALTRRLFDECKIIMTPGESQHAPKPGFYRICFAYNTANLIEQALTRTFEFLTKQQP
ncbi:unnamed protein product [Aphanomyces euteiches]